MTGSWRHFSEAPESETEGACLAGGCSLCGVLQAAHVEKLVRAWRRVDRQDELQHENLRHASRYLQAYTDEDGMVVLKARLDPEVGAAVLKALEAAEQVLYDRERETKNERGDGVPLRQRRADALGLVAESALASGIDKGTRAERLQVVVHVDEEVLEDPDAPGVSMLEDGTDVSAETSPHDHQSSRIGWHLFRIRVRTSDTQSLPYDRTASSTN